MNMVKIADLKNNLSRHLARVRRGAEITVYDRNMPVARIVPFVGQKRGAGLTGDEPARARVAELVRQGILSQGDPRAVADWLGGHEPVQLPDGAPSALNVLLEMRRESTR